jgi:hypothetical protein
VSTKRDDLRKEYLAAIEQEIVYGEARLAKAREQLDGDAPSRARTLAAISDVTLEWLETERDRLRAGGEFDEAAARRFLDERRCPSPRGGRGEPNA